MKLRLLVTLLILSFGIAACSNGIEGTSSDAEGNGDNYNVDKLEVFDGPLTKVDQYIKEDDGTIVTLKKIMSSELPLDLDPIKMTIQDIKLLEISNDDGKENVIQVSYIIENTIDEEIMFNGLKAITTDTKDQIDISLADVNGDASNGEYHGEVVKEGFVSLSYPGELIGDLKRLKIITSDVWDSNKPDKYHESITTEITFE